jgi:two-component system cell cycle response regulator CpdR
MSRVLVAEDDPEMRRLVAEALRRDWHDVIEASDGGQLLVRIAEEFHRRATLREIDLIVTDVRMAVCTGLELAETLAEDGWTIPCILITAFGDDETRARAGRIGAVLIDKPLSLEELRATVNRLAPAK